MNIKGKSRAGGRELAKHLLNAEKNETVKLLTIEGTVAQDLYGAFHEMEAIASGTQCKKPLYHAKISPDPKEPALTPKQWTRAIEALRDQLGLADHAYAAVLHRKYGAATPDILREHMHVVFNRINPDTMKAMHDGHNYRQHELVSRQLEKEFGHARIQGAHVDRDGTERPPRTPPDWAMQQAVKSGIQPRDVAATVKQLWKETDSPASFVAALKDEGLTLAMGRRDLVILDQAGDVHTLARCLDLKVADIRQQMAGIDRATVPTVDQAREAIRTQAAAKETPAPVWDRDQTNRDWEDSVIEAAIKKLAGDMSSAAPQRGTQPGPGREPKPANDNQREIDALAIQLQKARPEPDEPRGRQANDNEAAKEKLAAFGFDASQATTLEKWQQLQEKVDGGRITEKDRLREIAQYLWEQSDKEKRDEARNEHARERPHELDRER